MTLNVLIEETSRGSVRVEVPEGATEEQIWVAAYEAYCEGRAYLGDAHFTMTGYEKE